MFRLVITVLILYQVIGCLLSNDCDVLSDICRRDPDCVDDEVFYSKCIESYGRGDTHDIVNQPVAWADGNHPDEPVYIEKKKLNYNHLFNDYDNNHRKRQLEHLKDVYSDYEKESIRESLLLLKQKLDDQKDYVDVNRRFVSEDSDLTGSNIDHGSLHKDTIGKYVDIHNSNEDFVPQGTIDSNLNDDSKDNNINHKYMDSNSVSNNEHEEKDFNNHSNDEKDKNDYRKLLDSEVSRKLLERLNVKDDELGITEKSDTAVIKQNVAHEGESLQDKKNYEVINQDASLSVETLDDEKKSKIINKAFDLVQSLIKEQGTQDSDILLATVSAADEVKEKVINKKQLWEAAKSSDESLIPILEAHDKSISVDIGKDRSEVAVPEYINKDEEIHKEEEKNVGNEEDRGLVIVKTSDSLPDEKAVKIGTVLQRLLWNITNHKVLHFESVEDDNNAVYRMKINTSWFKFNDNAVYVAKRINTDDTVRANLNKDSGAVILSAESTSEDTYAESSAKDKERKSWDQLTLFSAVIAASVLGLLFAAIIVCIIKRKGKNLTPLIFKRQEAVQDYQELCRTQMSVANSPRPEDETEKNGTMKTWNDEQSPYNMDITTGHVILAYMEDHLKNENRLNKEWEALCSYKADQNETLAGSDIKHATKNRYRDVLPYDHTRVKLRSSSNAFHSDYINASFITDTDPRNPSYIATQGPLDNTVADFWQMVWEQGVVVIINLTKLSDMGLPQCHHYWPADGSEVYHIYEVHLISEHIWCDDYLVRSLYLKNLQTAETRTVTQFHYLTWPDLSIPSSPKPLLEFRRKVNKCYRGHACPVVVHCNNGVGRTGTYILLDMVLNKMIKGTKEIDIAATLEHLRDQRQDFVKTKGQFEFALLAVAEEVTAILSSVAR